MVLKLFFFSVSNLFSIFEFFRVWGKPRKSFSLFCHFHYVICIVSLNLLSITRLKTDLITFFFLELLVLWTMSCVSLFQGHLKDKLNMYVTVHFSKVKVFHSAERLGLIRARMFGASKASGEVRWEDIRRTRGITHCYSSVFYQFRIVFNQGDT